MLLVLCVTACSTSRKATEVSSSVLTTDYTNLTDKHDSVTVIIRDTLREVTTITIRENEQGDTLRVSTVTDRERLTTRDLARATEVKIVERIDTVYIQKDSVSIEDKKIVLSATSRRSELLLKNALADANAHVFVIRDEGHIVATATLCIKHTLEFAIADIESVVVSAKCRGRGYGKTLMSAMIEAARKMGVHHIQLTSNPRRVAANRLYQDLGFVRYETNCYKMPFAINDSSSTSVSVWQYLFISINYFLARLYPGLDAIQQVEGFESQFLQDCRCLCASTSAAAVDHYRPILCQLLLRLLREALCLPVDIHCSADVALCELLRSAHIQQLRR